MISEKNIKIIIIVIVITIYIYNVNLYLQASKEKPYIQYYCDIQYRNWNITYSDKEYDTYVYNIIAEFDNYNCKFNKTYEFNNTDEIVKFFNQNINTTEQRCYTQIGLFGQFSDNLYLCGFDFYEDIPYTTDIVDAFIAIFFNMMLVVLLIIITILIVEIVYNIGQIFINCFVAPSHPPPVPVAPIHHPPIPIEV